MERVPRRASNHLSAAPQGSKRRRHHGKGALLWEEAPPQSLGDFSMFVVTLTHVKPLAEIDAPDPAHIAWLERQSMPQAIFWRPGVGYPGVGGVILAQGVSRDALEAMLAEDPFKQQRRPIIRWWSLFRP